MVIFVHAHAVNSVATLFVLGTWRCGICPWNRRMQQPSTVLIRGSSAPAALNHGAAADATQESRPPKLKKACAEKQAEKETPESERLVILQSGCSSSQGPLLFLVISGTLLKFPVLPSCMLPSS
jgi:hypothetical protein